MTDPTSNGRAVDAPQPAVNFRVKTRPDGSTVLALHIVAAPYLLHEHRYELDPYLTRSLLHELTRNLHGIPDPGPRPEVAALLTALDSDDHTAFTAALDAYTARLHHLLRAGGEQA
ncbi:hypothetical protein AB0919_19370 [Streptomyces sp. NPDC046994]|uniref:hypothetical protein n=1 Tax=Streptomyces sp. NPDC046994 TaxID=3155735 RepID=UPI003453E502